MSSLRLVPYNDAMQLGQGYNSFLQVPRLIGAMRYRSVDLEREVIRTRNPAKVSQVVSYSCRFVEKISDVVRSMNISAAASIRSGTIQVSGNSLSVDEVKFAASDMNAVVSVKVVNQTTIMEQDPEFAHLDGVTFDSAKFFQIYGDCYISGFIEGGDFHGIVSMKALDISRKSQIESDVKGALNATANEFSLSEGISSTALGAALTETESTITVNWSGGGQIKDEGQGWTFDSVLHAAAGFPARVASCPQLTWAILTRYDHNRSFLTWAAKSSIEVPRFSNCQQYAADLLDAYMGWKYNLAELQAVMANPAAYKLSSAKDAIPLTMEDLVVERATVRGEMQLIVNTINSLNVEPFAPLIGQFADISSPELWATRLPVSKNTPSAHEDLSTNEMAKIMGGLWFEKPAKAPEAQPQPQPPAVISDSITRPLGSIKLEAKERDWVVKEENRKLYAAYRFDGQTGGSGGTKTFNDAVDLQQQKPPVPASAWPTAFVFEWVSFGNNTSDCRLLGFSVIYDKASPLKHGAYTDSPGLRVNLAEDEKIVKVSLASSDRFGMIAIDFMELRTRKSDGKVERSYTAGLKDGKTVVDYMPFDGKTGLKGFWGASGDAIDRMGPIWGS